MLIENINGLLLILGEELFDLLDLIGIEILALLKLFDSSRVPEVRCNILEKGSALFTLQVERLI